MKGLAGPIGELAASIRFLTVIPLPGASGKYGASAFPLCGLAIGGILVSIDAALSVLPWELRNLLLVVAGALLTGGLHYDGLADFLDALGGQNCADRLRILADPGVGTFGVLGVVLAVGTRVAALMLLVGGARVTALLVAPTLARWAMILTATNAPSARPGGLGDTFVGSIGRIEAVLAAVTAVSAAAVLAAGTGAVAIVLTVIVAIVVRQAAIQRFGGVTGDVVGTAGEITEVLVLVLFGSLGGQ